MNQVAFPTNNNNNLKNNKADVRHCRVSRAPKRSRWETGNSLRAFGILALYLVDGFWQIFFLPHLLKNFPRLFNPLLPLCCKKTHEKHCCHSRSKGVEQKFVAVKPLNLPKRLLQQICYFTGPFVYSVTDVVSFFFIHYLKFKRHTLSTSVTASQTSKSKLFYIFAYEEKTKTSRFLMGLKEQDLAKV